ncbi:retrovirus-related Pol polyprotein from transposon 17.6 [Nephila pilipes]|uniref:Retrovirus-related Pol polyprotein from transposon 17.6 n=1 Tax=Nephila pilipes TaxID=299642 RepID=A0A8X6N0N5_NEPPI|nr:retrovirus-related Pol polyprotein from transposon 17.6 [Nephila pilipes]
MCSLPPPPRGSTIAQPRNTSRQNQYSNSQTSAQFPSSSSSTSSNNHALVETTSLNSSNSRRNNNNRNSTSGRSTTANNPSINCIRTQMNRRALIPVIINNDTEIQALCDPCADITVIQESCVLSDIVIHPWNDGQFQVVDHEIKPIEPDRQFLKSQIQKWLKQGICRHSNSPYAAPTFIVDQPFHESTPRRVVVDFSRTINPITKIDPHPIDQMEDVIQRSAGKRYNSKMDVKSAFHCIRIRETDTYKTGFVTPDGHYEFLRMPFGVPNGPSTMTRAIKKAYDHLAPHNFQKYIRNDAVIAKPLTSVLKGLEKKTSSAPIVLTDDQQQTDASYSGLGAVLSQEQNGKRRIIEYASRTLKDAETRYHSNELECTAVHWALTEKFRLYLLGHKFRLYLLSHKFQLITDNYTTAYVVAKSAINRKFARYLVDLAQFDFTTEHRPGKQNVVADHLSRFPTPPVCLVVTASYETEICGKQKRDDFCQYNFRLLKEKNPNKKTMSIICNYNIDNNTLVRNKDEKSKSVVVIPKAMREQTLICCHDDVGHMDAKKTLHNLKLRY